MNKITSQYKLPALIRIDRAHKDKMDKKYWGGGRSNFHGNSHKKRRSADGSTNGPESKMAKIDD